MARFKGKKNGKACTLEIQGRKLRLTPKGCGVDDWVVFKASDIKYRDPYYLFKGKKLFDPASHKTWLRLHEYLDGKTVYRGGKYVKVSTRKKSRKGKSTRKSRKGKKKSLKRVSLSLAKDMRKKKSKRKSKKSKRKSRKSKKRKKSKSKKRKRKSR